jgi:HEAT repeat protein
MDGRFPDEWGRLAASFATATNGRDSQRLRHLLLSGEREAVAAALVEALRRADDSRAFSRTATLLAEIGGDEAAEALALHARTQRRFPRLAVRALSRCEHPTVVPALLDILKFGRIKQRRAAAFALARIGAPVAVEPLCREAAKGELGIAPEARAALLSMGKAWATALRVLADPDMAPRDRVRTLLAMEIWPERRFLLPSRWFDAEVFLAREAANGGSPVRVKAQEAYDLLLAQRTLLRAAHGQNDHSALLRAAQGGGAQAAGGHGLLRAAFGLPAEMGERLRPVGLWGWFLALLRRGWAFKDDKELD